MQIILDKELLNRLIYIFAVTTIILSSFILANNLKINNYPTVIVEPFTLNVTIPSLTQDQEFIINKTEKVAIKEKENEENVKTVEIKPQFKNIHVSLIIISKKNKKCVINNVILMENQYLDNDIKVLEITEYGVILQTRTGEIFIKSGEHKII